MTKFLVYISICFLRQLFIEKPTLHSMQSNCLSPGCVCMCSFKWPFGEKYSLHSLQLNSFFLVSVWICVFRTQHHIFCSFNVFPLVTTLWKSCSTLYADERLNTSHIPLNTHISSKVLIASRQLSDCQAHVFHTQSFLIASKAGQHCI